MLKDRRLSCVNTKKILRSGGITCAKLQAVDISLAGNRDVEWRVRKYIRIVVSALLLTLIAWRVDWSEVNQKFAHLRVELWFAAVGLYLLATIASARRWQLYARDMGFEQTLPQYCAYSLVGMFFSLLLPTLIGGDVIRVWYLNGDSGRKWSAIASVFLERVNGLLILIATACVGVLLSPVELPAWIVVSVLSIAGCRNRRTGERADSAKVAAIIGGAARTTKDVHRVAAFVENAS